VGSEIPTPVTEYGMLKYPDGNIEQPNYRQKDKVNGYGKESNRKHKYSLRNPRTF